jgi:hypothetical protein
MIALERRLEPVDRPPEIVDHATGVVRQHVDPGETGQLVGKGPDLVEALEIGAEMRRRPHLGHRVGETSRVTTHQDHLVAACGELLRGGQPHTRAAAGDHDCRHPTIVFTIVRVRVRSWVP